MKSLFTTAALAFGLLIAGSSPALAAKGVKKKNATGLHHVHGVVTHVHHHKGKTANGHIGEIHVKSHHHKKKGQPAANGVKVSGHTHKFSVGATTHISAVHGKQRTAASFASVRKGEHVTVSHKANHASAIAIHHHHHTKKMKNTTAAKPKKGKKKLK